MCRNDHIDLLHISAERRRRTFYIQLAWPQQPHILIHKFFHLPKSNLYIHQSFYFLFKNVSSIFTSLNKK